MLFRSPNLQKLPDPEKFNGTKEKLRPFLAQLRLKAAIFPSDQAKLRFSVSVLTGDALDIILPYIQNDQINLDNLAALITILEGAFGNPNKIADAEYKLNTIQQGTRDFSSYYAEFQRYTSEVGWNDLALLAALKRGLSYRLRQDFVAIENEPTTLIQYVNVCNRLDTKRRALQID